MTVVIAVCSGKGGVGKSLITANLTVALSSLGHPSLGVDLDLPMANLCLYVGADRYGIKPKAFVHDALLNFEKIHEALVSGPENSKFILGNPQLKVLSKIDVAMERVEPFISQLKTMLDVEYIILDCPAGVFLPAYSVADMGLIVTVPTMSSLVDGYKTFKLLQGMNVQPYIVFNQCELRKGLRGIDYAKTCKEIFGSEPYAILPVISKNVLARVDNKGELLVVDHPKEPFSVEIMKLAKKLVGEEVTVEKETHKESFFSKLVSIFRRG